MNFDFPSSFPSSFDPMKGALDGNPISSQSSFPPSSSPRGSQNNYQNNNNNNNYSSFPPFDTLFSLPADVPSSQSHSQPHSLSLPPTSSLWDPLPFSSNFHLSMNMNMSCDNDDSSNSALESVGVTEESEFLHSEIHSPSLLDGNHQNHMGDNNNYHDHHSIHHDHMNDNFHHVNVMSMSMDIPEEPTSEFNFQRLSLPSAVSNQQSQSMVMMTQYDQGNNHNNNTQPLPLSAPIDNSMEIAFASSSCSLLCSSASAKDSTMHSSAFPSATQSLSSNVKSEKGNGKRKMTDERKSDKIPQVKESKKRKKVETKPIPNDNEDDNSDSDDSNCPSDVSSGDDDNEIDDATAALLTYDQRTPRQKVLPDDISSLSPDDIKQRKLARKAELARISRRRKKFKLRDYESHVKCLQSELKKLKQKNEILEREKMEKINQNHREKEKEMENEKEIRIHSKHQYQGISQVKKEEFSSSSSSSSPSLSPTSVEPVIAAATNGPPLTYSQVVSHLLHHLSSLSAAQQAASLNILHSPTVEQCELSLSHTINLLFQVEEYNQMMTEKHLENIEKSLFPSMPKRVLMWAMKMQQKEEEESNSSATPIPIFSTLFSADLSLTSDQHRDVSSLSLTISKQHKFQDEVLKSYRKLHSHIQRHQRQQKENLEKLRVILSEKQFGLFIQWVEKNKEKLQQMEQFNMGNQNNNNERNSNASTNNKLQ